MEGTTEENNAASIAAEPSASQGFDKGKSKSIFRHLESARAQSAVQNLSEKSEVSTYLECRIEDPSVDPLSCWKSKSNSLPKLSKLAKIYLGIPASSGSVERMFSIAGALQRSRRASLSWSTIEKLLCHRDMRVGELFGKKQMP